MSTHDAIHWDGTPVGAVPVLQWLLSHGARCSFHTSGAPGAHDTRLLRVATPQGETTFRPGDTITKTNDGFHVGEPDLLTLLGE